jgi:hypothetical protein
MGDRQARGRVGGEKSTAETHSAVCGVGGTGSRWHGPRPSHPHGVLGAGTARGGGGDGGGGGLTLCLSRCCQTSTAKTL